MHDHPDDSIGSLRAWRARLEAAEDQLAEREQRARGRGDRADLDDIAAARDRLRTDWDALAERHDAWARRRDLIGLTRDKRSSDRDVAARRIADDQDLGFASRWHAAGDRDDSSGDRSDSFDDRRNSSAAREHAASDRDRAATDRDDAAEHAAGLAEEVRDLEQAAATRTVVGQALGLLMARHGLSSDDAFAELIRLSQDTGTAVTEVATAMVADAEPGAG